MQFFDEIRSLRIDTKIIVKDIAVGKILISRRDDPGKTQ